MSRANREPVAKPQDEQSLVLRLKAGDRMKRTTRSITSSLSISLLCLAIAQAACSLFPVRYQMTFERTWSPETHPQDFPPLAHFSPAIGATHNASFEIFPMGTTATAGPERLCEEGKHKPLDGEIREAIEKGAAGVLIETSNPLRSAPGQAMAVFAIDAKHPMVSIAAMLAPSPDWCAVAANVVLYQDGQWIAKKTVALEAWDMGTDSATRYRALDDDTQPRGKIQRSESPYFVKDGKRVSVGSVTFVRQWL